MGTTQAQITDAANVHDTEYLYRSVEDVGGKPVGVAVFRGAWSAEEAMVDIYRLEDRMGVSSLLAFWVRPAAGLSVYSNYAAGSSLSASETAELWRLFGRLMAGEMGEVVAGVIDPTGD